MKEPFRLSLALMCAVVLLGTTGCEDNRDRYEQPPWLGGSSIETLEKRGNYTIFLELMDKAGYTDPITKQLFTLFVPDDDAFEEFFAQEGIGSVEEMSEEYARNLFTLHVLRNPRARYYLIYEYAWSEFQGPKGEYASLFHRKPTPAVSIPYTEEVRYVPGDVGKTFRIYTGNKNVPLFSKEWFGDFGGALDGSDYTFMYPGSTWEEGYPDHLDGLNWHNAMVIPNPENTDELEVRTSSGFIYFLDRVVPIMPSIEEYMIENQDKYGLFYDLLQRFAQYTNSRVDEERNVEYMKSYELVFDLANERGPSTNTAVPPQNMWTAFLPKDEMLQEYLDNTIFKYYESIDSVPRTTLFYVLQSQLSGSLVLRSKLASGYFNAFGDPTELNPDDLISGFMCSNGVVYELNKVLEPNVFTTVAGTLFFDKNYSTMLAVLNAANMLSAISNPDSDVTLFASTNQTLEEYGIRYNEASDVIEFRGPVDGKWGPMRTSDLTQFAQSQIYLGLLDLAGDEKFAELSSGTYFRYGNNQVAAGENLAFNRPSQVVEIVENELNGYMVKVDKPIQTRFVMGQHISCPYNDEECTLADPELSEFANILIELRLLDHRARDPITKESIPKLKFLAADDYWTAFIPDNAAMAQARLDGIIPEEMPTSSEGRDSLENFVLYHFLPGEVVFDNGEESGIYETNYTFIDTTENETVAATLELINEPGSLSVLDASGNVVLVDHADANVLTEKGAIHKISTVLNYMEPNN